MLCLWVEVSFQSRSVVSLLCINTFSVDQKQQVKWKSNSNSYESTGRKLEDRVLTNNYSDTFLFLTEEINYQDASIKCWGLTNRTTGTKKSRWVGGKWKEDVADSSSSLDLCGKIRETWRLQRQRRVWVWSRLEDSQSCLHPQGQASEARTHFTHFILP